MVSELPSVGPGDDSGKLHRRRCGFALLFILVWDGMLALVRACTRVAYYEVLSWENAIITLSVAYRAFTLLVCLDAALIGLVLLPPAAACGPRGGVLPPAACGLRQGAWLVCRSLLATAFAFDIVVFWRTGYGALSDESLHYLTSLSELRADIGVEPSWVVMLVVVLLLFSCLHCLCWGAHRRFSDWPNHQQRCVSRCPPFGCPFRAASTLSLGAAVLFIPAAPLFYMIAMPSSSLISSLASEARHEELVMALLPNKVAGRPWIEALEFKYCDGPADGRCYPAASDFILPPAHRKHVLLFVWDSVRFATEFPTYNELVKNPPDGVRIHSQDMHFTNGVMTEDALTALLLSVFPHSMEFGSGFPALPLQILKESGYNLAMLSSWDWMSSSFVRSSYLWDSLYFGKAVGGHEDSVAQNDGEVLRRGVRILEDATEPWFIVMHFACTHGPYAQNPPYSPAFTHAESATEYQKYKNNALAVDEFFFNRTLPTLIPRIRQDELLVFFAGDHGSSFSKDGSPIVRSMPMAMDNLVMKVPFVSFTGTSAPEYLPMSYTTHCDFLPSLVDMLSMPPSGMDMLSMAPSGGKAPRQPDPALWSNGQSWFRAPRRNFSVVEQGIFLKKRAPLVIVITSRGLKFKCVLSDHSVPEGILFEPKILGVRNFLDEPAEIDPAYFRTISTELVREWTTTFAKLVGQGD